MFFFFHPHLRMFFFFISMFWCSSTTTSTQQQHQPSNNNINNINPAQTTPSFNPKPTKPENHIASLPPANKRCLPLLLPHFPLFLFLSQVFPSSLLIIPNFTPPSLTIATTSPFSRPQPFLLSLFLSQILFAFLTKTESDLPRFGLGANTRCKISEANEKRGESESNQGIFLTLFSYYYYYFVLLILIYFLFFSIDPE